jgi:hypothetical protein
MKVWRQLIPGLILYVGLLLLIFLDPGTGEWGCSAAGFAGYQRETGRLRPSRHLDAGTRGYSVFGMSGGSHQFSVSVDP